jgi:hypothetical protein
MNVDARPLRELLHKGMKSGNQSQVVQRRRAQFPGKKMYNVHRFFHHPLRPRNLLLEIPGVVHGLPGQSRQMDIDAHQGLGDFIMQLAADALSFLIKSF